MKNLKLIIGIILILFSGILIVNSSTQTDVEKYFQIPNGKFGHQILNPLKQVDSQSSLSTNGENKNNFKKEITNKYFEFKDYSKEPSKLSCLIGGDYLLNAISKATGGTPAYYQVTLFSCKTTQDLINLIKIPNTWSQDEIIIYCNDGKKINSKENNFDFLTSKISTYKACIIRNVNKDLTILAGFDVGNSIVDDESINFFNSTNNRGSIINSQFEFKSNSGNTIIFKDLKDSLDYSFSYDNTNKFYTLRNFNDQLTDNINNIFTRNIGISRIALHKKLKNSKIIYGYETSIVNKFASQKTKIVPIYEISYGSSIGINDNTCSNYLKKYDSIDTGLFLPSTKIRCLGSKILINSNAIDGSRYGTKNGHVDSFNIFKNIILGLN